MEDLKHYVLDANAAVGLAYDTDGDRFGMVDDKGNMYDTDQLLMLYAKHVLKDMDVTFVNSMDEVLSAALMKRRAVRSTSKRTRRTGKTIN